MLRFLTFLLNKPYEPCKSCETLKEQLEFERDEKKRLTDMLLEIMRPKVVVQPQEVNLEEVKPQFTTFSRRRAALEQADRIAARTRATSTLRQEPDDKKELIEKLEQETGTEETETEQQEKAN